MRDTEGGLRTRAIRIGAQRGPSPGERVPDAPPDAASASIVIPAHNDRFALGCCLEAVAAAAVGRRCEVIVVASGCDDRTTSIARSFSTRLPGLVVVECGDVGRTAALNLGDDLASGFPRIYLDADVILEDGALWALISALDRDEPVVAAPTASYDVSRSSAPVRAFYRTYAEQRGAGEGLIGLGVYGLSAAGRARFAHFPAVVADDVFIQHCFPSSERITSGGEFTVSAPRRVQDIVRAHRRSGGAGSAVERADGGEVGTSGTLRTLVRADHPGPVHGWSGLVSAGARTLRRRRSTGNAAAAQQDGHQIPTQRGPVS